MTAQMRLYSGALSPYSARARIAIHYKGLPIEIVHPSIIGGMHTAAYRAINPIDKMPTLVLEDGTAIPESQVIVDYLEDRFPEPSLRPPTPEARARAALLARIAEIYVMGAMSGLGTMMPIRQTRIPVPRNEDLVAEGMKEVGLGLDRLEHFLDERGPFAAGPQVTFADCSIVPFLVFAEVYSKWFDRPDAVLGGRPKLSAYWNDGMYADPSLTFVRAEVADALQVRMKARMQELNMSPAEA